MSELFSSILIPGFFLLACILQLHYFHRPFMQLTDLEHVPPPGTRRLRWAHRFTAFQDHRGPVFSQSVSRDEMAILSLDRSCEAALVPVHSG